MRICLPIRASLILISLLSLEAAAHEDEAHYDEVHETEAVAQALPEHTLSLALRLRHLGAPETWPPAWALPGRGRAANRDLSFEESGLSWRARWTPWLYSELSWLRDHDDKMAVDEAVLGLREANWQAQAGRFTVLARDSQWALPSLFAEALNGHDHWHDEGVQVAWRDPDRSLSLAAIRGQGYPGADKAQTGWMLGATQRLAGQQVSLDLGMLPKLARETSGTTHAGHDHGPSRCGEEQDCLKGRASLARLQWQWQQGSLSGRLMGGWRRESGNVSGPLGEADYRGDTRSVQGELAWQWRPALSLAGRYEALALQHRLQGAGAVILANNAGLTQSATRVQRLGLAWQYRPAGWGDWSLETWREHAQGQAAQTLWLAQWRQRWALLR